MVEIKDLEFGYGARALFEQIDLNLRPGKIYGLLGENGAGKSSLLKILAGLLFPRSGSLVVAGHEPARREAAFLSSLFVLPETLNLPAMTPGRYVRSLSPFYPELDHERLGRYLVELGVPRGRRLSAMSLGQQKKFLLSFGLASNVSLLLLDEPTNGLDIPSKGLFRRLVAESLSDRQIFVLSTHQVRDVESLIDRIVVLHEGKVLFDRDLAEVASKLRITRAPRRPEDTADGLLYCEPTVGGFACVWKTEQEAGGQLDLEILFKAIIAEPGVFRSLFLHNGE